jgi:hypothetical protein
MNSEELTLPVSGRKITVHEATAMHSQKRGRLINDGRQKSFDDVDMQEAATFYYPTIAACSTGEVPNLEEYIEMKARDAEVWMGAVLDKNPHWFGQDSEEKKMK